MWRKTSEPRPQGRISGRSGPRLLRRAALAALCLLVLGGAGCSLPRGPAPAGERVSGALISRTALAAVGTRYAYGGSSPASGFDCSGLVAWAYAKNGVTMPRTTGEQNRVGCAVGRGGLKPGDLVVFRVRGGLHTGIYTGKGRFVHSPRRGSSVRVDDINSKYWRNCFVAGRRHDLVY